MKPLDPKIWHDMHDVEIMKAHVDRAIVAFARETPAVAIKTVHFENVMLAATVIAYIEALAAQVGTKGVLSRVVYGEVGVELRKWIIEAHGQIDPFDDSREIQRRENERRTAERQERAAFSKARREAKRTAEIETAVAQRLKAA